MHVYGMNMGSFNHLVSVGKRAALRSDVDCYVLNPSTSHSSGQPRHGGIIARIRQITGSYEAVGQFPGQGVHLLHDLEISFSIDLPDAVHGGQWPTFRIEDGNGYTSPLFESLAVIDGVSLFTNLGELSLHLIGIRDRVGGIASQSLGSVQKPPIVFRFVRKEQLAISHRVRWLGVPGLEFNKLGIDSRGPRQLNGLYADQDAQDCVVP
jgi:hypothetical protein